MIANLERSQRIDAINGFSAEDAELLRDAQAEVKRLEAMIDEITAKAKEFLGDHKIEFYQFSGGIGIRLVTTIRKPVAWKEEFVKALGPIKAEEISAKALPSISTRIIVV